MPLQSRNEHWHGHWARLGDDKLSKQLDGSAMMSCMHWVESAGFGLIKSVPKKSGPLALLMIWILCLPLVVNAVTTSEAAPSDLSIQSSSSNANVPTQEPSQKLKGINSSGQQNLSSLTPCSADQWKMLNIDPKVFAKQSELDQAQLIFAVQAMESSCLRSAVYYAQLGQLLLLAHHPKEALEALERSLLLKPDAPAVQLDFAVSLADSGDPISAKALVRQVLLRPDLPVELRASLEQVLSEGNVRANQFGEASVTPGVAMRGSNAGQEKFTSSDVSWVPFGIGWQTQGSAQLYFGHDTNLNSASFVNTINLTLPNGTVPLTLDASSLPQSGATEIAATQLITQRGVGDKVLLVSGSWMGRNPINSPNFGFNNEEFLAELKPKDGSGLHHRVGIDHFEIGGSDFYNSASYALWLENSRNSKGILNLSEMLACRTRLGAILERRTYAQDTTQNGIFGAATLGATCSNENNEINLGFVTGKDWASNKERAGGDQRRQELRASWSHSFETSKITMDWNEQWLNDEAIYSELLGGNNRNTHRKSTRVSFQYKFPNKLVMMSGSLFWVSYWESQRYSSSVDLFNLKGDSVQTGLKWDF